MNAENSEPTAFLLAAAYYGGQEAKTKKAIKLLDKARYLPMQRGLGGSSTRRSCIGRCSMLTIKSSPRSAAAPP